MSDKTHNYPPTGGAPVYKNRSSVFWFWLTELQLVGTTTTFTPLRNVIYSNFSLLLLQTPLISGIPHLPVWLHPQVASKPPQEEAPTSKVLLLLLHGRARPGGRNYLFFFLLFFFACFLASTSCSLKLHFSAGAFFLLSSWARSCSLTAGAPLRARSCSLTAGALLRAMSGCCTAIRSSSSCSAAA